MNKDGKKKSRVRASPSTKQVSNVTLLEKQLTDGETRSHDYALFPQKQNWPDPSSVRPGIQLGSMT